jgi:dihydroxyacid dehydratase/phosphogluconate dehydratase
LTKPAAIHPEMHTFAGKARCFDAEEEANQASLEGEIQAGEVLMIRYEGSKGVPGMREMATAMNTGSKILFDTPFCSMFRQFLDELFDSVF